MFPNALKTTPIFVRSSGTCDLDLRIATRGLPFSKCAQSFMKPRIADLRFRFRKSPKRKSKSQVFYETGPWEKWCLHIGDHDMSVPFVADPEISRHFSHFGFW